MSLQSVSRLFSAIIAVTAFACAGSPSTSVTAPDAEPAAGGKVSDISLKIAPDVEAKWKDKGERPDAERLLIILRTSLEAQQLFTSDAGSGTKLEVVVTDFELRTTYGNVLWGMATGGLFSGSDKLGGTVAVLDKDGKPLNTFNVSSGYSGGDSRKVPMSQRADIMYKEFGKRTAQRLGGVAQPK